MRTCQNVEREMDGAEEDNEEKGNKVGWDTIIAMQIFSLLHIIVIAHYKCYLRYIGSSLKTLIPYLNLTQ